MTTIVPPLDPWSLLIQGASMVASNSAQIQSLWDRAWAAMTQSNSRIVVTGLPGVGKSVLFDHISGRGGIVGYQLPGKSLAAERERLKQGKQRWAITIVPGQESPVRLEILEDAFRRGKKVDGVVYVAANGYSTIRERLAEQALIQAGMTLAKYIDAQRAEEVSDFARVSNEIRIAMRRKRNRAHNPWLLVAVNKLDLFCEDPALPEAYQRYSAAGGAFHSEIESLLRSVGRDNFRCEVLPVASFAQDFTFGAEVAKSAMPQATRNETLVNLVRIMGDLCEGV